MRVNVATDLWGKKENVQLIFNVEELTLSLLFNRIEQVLQDETLRQKPAGIALSEVQLFAISSVLLLRSKPISAAGLADAKMEGSSSTVVGSTLQQWEEVGSVHQLYDECQLFVFQPVNVFHSDTQGKLPAPRLVWRDPAVAVGSSEHGSAGSRHPLSSPLSSSSSVRSPTFDREEASPFRVPEMDATCNGAPMQVAQIVYKLLGGKGRGYIQLSDFQSLLQQLNFDQSIIEDVLLEERVSYRQWLSFTEANLGIVALVAEYFANAKFQRHSPAGVALRAFAANRSTGTLDTAEPDANTSRRDSASSSAQRMSPSPRPVSGAASPHCLISPPPAVAVGSNSSKASTTSTAGIDTVVIQNRTLSPPRNNGTTPDQRQRVASERLSAGYSSVAVKKDREDERRSGARDPLYVTMEAKAARIVKPALRASSAQRKDTTISRWNH